MPRLPLSYPLRNIGRRPGRACITAGGSALAAALVVATVSFVQGITDSAMRTAPPRSAILLSRASTGDLVRSAISPSVAELVAADVAGVLEIGGQPAVSPEIHMASRIEVNGRMGRGFLRGVTDRAFLVHEQVTLTEGRPPRAGEVLIGRLVPDSLGLDPQQLGPGDRIRYEGADHVVSGVFHAPGTTMESEIWAPLAELMGEARREDVSAVFLRLRDEADFDDVDLFAARRLDLELLALRAGDYYRELAAYFQPLRLVAWAMAAMVALAVLCGGANVMNAAVQDRMRELATLRAIGYPGAAVVLAILAEALLHGAIGGLLGVALARLAVSGASVHLAMQSFALDVRPEAVCLGYAASLGLAVLGALPSALRAARSNIVQALGDP